MAASKECAIKSGLSLGRNDLRRWIAEWPVRMRGLLGETRPGRWKQNRDRSQPRQLGTRPAQTQHNIGTGDTRGHQGIPGAPGLRLRWSIGDLG